MAVGRAVEIFWQMLLLGQGMLLREMRVSERGDAEGLGCEGQPVFKVLTAWFKGHSLVEGWT